MDWRDMIVDVDERKVFEALENPKWDYRTIGGIIRETGLDEKFVAKVIDGHPDLVRKSIIPSLLVLG